MQAEPTPPDQIAQHAMDPLRFFRQAPYAEDQPHARTLLTAHVSHRMLQTGALLSLPIGLASSAFSARRAGAHIKRSVLLAGIPRSAGVGALIGLTLGIPVTFGQMHGREEIEWQDRAWRLLGNRGQVEVDAWSSVGFLIGGMLAARRGGTGLVRMVGGASLGNLAGVGGYMGWRYGIKGGKWED